MDIGVAVYLPTSTYLLLPQSRTQTSENNGITLDSPVQGTAQLFLVEVTFPAHGTWRLESPCGYLLYGTWGTIFGWR